MQVDMQIYSAFLDARDATEQLLIGHTCADNRAKEWHTREAVKQIAAAAVRLGYKIEKIEKPSESADDTSETAPVLEQFEQYMTWNR